MAVSGVSSTNTTAASTSASNVGTGVLSSAGVGSGLDVDSIVTALVDAKKSGPQTQITAKATQTNATLTGLASLSSALTSLQSSLSKLTDANTFSSFNATLGDTALGSVSTRSNAQPGSYQLNVTQLATAQKRSSDAFAKTDTFGAGTLDIGVGSNTLKVSISSTDTLADIAGKINKSSDNPGVTATVVNGADGVQLLLSSNDTGVAKGFSISAESGADAGLSALATQLGTAGANEAQDAQLTLDGIAITSASNEVSGAIDGVTINLQAAGNSKLTITRDTSVATDAIKGFVDAYNSYTKTISTLSSYDEDTGQAGILLGDATLGAVQRQVSSLLGSKVAGNSIGSLAALGVTRQVDGSLGLDSDRLATALDTSGAAVKDLFAGSNGYATQLNSALDAFTASSGVIGTRQQSLTDSLSNLNTQQTKLDDRMSVYEKQLRDQYTALDTLMSSLNNTSTYLTGALAALEATYTKTNN